LTACSEGLRTVKTCSMGHSIWTRSWKPEQSGQTWIISWPDYSGLQDLVRIIWTMLHVSMVRRPLPQAVKPEPFTSHFDWFGVHPPRPFQDHLIHLVYLHLSKVPRSSKLPRYPGLFSLPVTKIWIVWSNPGPIFSFSVTSPLAHNICFCTNRKPKHLTT